MQEDYFEKYLEQRFASIDETFSAIKEENSDLRADFRDLSAEMRRTAERTADQVQRSVDQTLAEMREKDNQRHAENLAINARIDANIESIENKMDAIKRDNDGVNKWLIAFLIGTFISIVSIAISVYIK